MPGKLMLITKQWLGHAEPADAEFGRKMLVKFFHTPEGTDDKPDVMCFYVEGVKVVCEGSPAISSLRALEEDGVEIASCQTCLDYYGLADKVTVGRISGMDAIVSLMTSADVVITP